MKFSNTDEGKKLIEDMKAYYTNEEAIDLSFEAGQKGMVSIEAVKKIIEDEIKNVMWLVPDDVESGDGVFMSRIIDFKKIDKELSALRNPAGAGEKK